MSTTTAHLPRITPRSTSVSRSGSNGSSQSFERPKVVSAEQMMKAYSVYPPRLPTAPEGPSRRINVLRPDPPKKFNHMLETTDPHWHNDKRALRMKRREHYRYHNAWSKYYYGTASEQEEYRSYTRSVLKQQMSDRDSHNRHLLIEKVKESEMMSERDRRDKLEDAEKFQRRFERLKGYRDQNKTMMENTWQERRQTKAVEDLFDREQMRYNPINWSMTLK